MSIDATAQKPQASDTDATREQGQVIVTCEGLGKTYTTGKVSVAALEDINMSVRRGEFLCLCGPSGSGKSTLLNLIGGLDTPDAGTVTVVGRELNRLKRDELANLRLHHLGIVFQAFNLIPVLSARENVEMVLQVQGRPASERRAIALRCLADVGLEELADRRPAELSGGQQQRVAIARAIAPGPDLILADEPSASLDSRTAESLLELMAGLNARHGVTFVLSTHDERVMKYAGRLIRLRDGRIESEENRS